MRIYPHHQDTGGFFIACFVKTDNGLLDEKINNDININLDTNNNPDIKGTIVVNSLSLINNSQISNIL